MTDGVGSFIQRLNEGEAGQILKLAGTVSGALGAVTGFISLFEPSDTDKILDAIEDLREDMTRNFQQLGDLITRQTQLVVETVNRNDMALALSGSDIAFSRMQEYLANNNNAALETAKTESIRGVSFFLNLGRTSPDLPFFIPGLVKAGTIRIFVIAAEPNDLREPRTSVDNEVHSMVEYLATMIDTIKRKVNAAHTIVQHDHKQSCPAIQPIAPAEGSTLAEVPHRTVFVVDGFSHEENGVRLQYFEVIQDFNPCEGQIGSEIDAARSRAVEARSKGVKDELDFLGVPHFEQILQSWRNLLTA